MVITKGIPVKKHQNEYANKLIIAIGKLNAVLAEELFKHHGVKKDYLKFYSEKNVEWLLSELGKVRAFNETVYHNRKTRFTAAHHFSLYRTKHAPIGKIIPGDRITTYLNTKKMIQDYILNEERLDSFNLPPNQKEVVDKIVGMYKTFTVLDVHPSIKHEEVFITIHFNPHKGS